MIIDARVRVPRREDENDPLVEVPKHLERYQPLYRFQETINYTVKDLLSQMDAAQVDKAVLHAEFEWGGYAMYKSLNDRVAALVKRYPSRFVGVASVDPHDGELAMEELNRAVLELGLRGLNLAPSFFGISPNDRLLYPFYARCHELGIPVSIHIGVHFSSIHPLHLGNPLELDEIACRFPGLKIVGLHGGWPWILEAIAVARRHPTVYLEFGAIAPKYFARPGSGWEPVLQFGNSVLQDQILFASDWPNLPHSRFLEEHSQLPWKPEVREKIFNTNVRKLYEFPD